MEELNRAQELFPERDTALYVYAYGGDGSEKATSRLKAMGFARVYDIGGIKNCCGNLGYSNPTEGTGWASCPLVEPPCPIEDMT